MTQPYPYPPAPYVTGPPASVTTAAMLTWVGCGVTGSFALLFGAILGPVALAILDAFGQSRWIWIGTGIAVAAGCVLASICAAQLQRRAAWARWTLVGLSLATVPAGLVGGPLLWPLIAAGLGIAVTVLLLSPSARSWFAAAP